jgi:hypothetical protein
MMNLLKALRQDEYGVILSTEIVIIGSLLVIGLITGLTCLQKSVNGELQDLAGAIGALDQSYSFSGHRKSGYAGQCCAYTAGSAFHNCERTDHHHSDLLGCEGTCAVHQSACGNCGHCSSCVGGAVTRTPCGTCGGRAGGCSSCGFGTLKRFGPNEVDSGVPKLKVTEWPSADYPVESGPPAQHGPVFESDGLNQAIPPVPHIEHSFGFERHMHPHSQSVPPAPLPSPDAHWNHSAPIPPTFHHPRGKSQFNFPQHVW